MNNENHILTTTSNVSKKATPRSISDVVLKLNEEVGELSTEIGIKKVSYKIKNLVKME